MAASDRVLVGRIGAPHGVRGEVRVKSFTADPAALGGYGPLATGDGSSLAVERLRPAGEVLVVKFRGIADRDAAARLTGTELFVARSSLPEPEEDEFYHADLIGLEAVGETGAPLGIVVAVHDFGAGAMLDIAPPRGASRLVPFTREAVPKVDFAAGRVVVVPPPETEARGEEEAE